MRKTAVRGFVEVPERASCGLRHKRGDTSWKHRGKDQWLGHHCQPAHWSVVVKGQNPLQGLDPTFRPLLHVLCQIAAGWTDVAEVGVVFLYPLASVQTSHFTVVADAP